MCRCPVEKRCHVRIGVSGGRIVISEVRVGISGVRIGVGGGRIDVKRDNMGVGGIGVHIDYKTLLAITVEILRSAC